MKLVNFLSLVCIALFFKISAMPSPQDTWEKAKQFESFKILEEIGYKLTDHEIRQDIYRIRKKAPNTYSYFCRKIEKKRNKIQKNLFKELHKIVDDAGAAEFKNKLATIKKIPAFENKKNIELIGLEEFSLSVQETVRTFVTDHKDSLPPKISFVPYNRYTAQYQNSDGIVTAPTTDDELTTKFFLNHEMGHLCDKQLEIVNKLCDLYYTIARAHADQKYKNQKKNKTVSVWLSSLDQFHNKYKCSRTFVEICHKRELLADALATNNNKQMTKTGFVDFSQTKYPAPYYIDSYSHPSLLVRIHQLATLHRYYKIEQKMCKEYGLMGYQHGNLFN
jgi:hypothetical protein